MRTKNEFYSTLKIQRNMVATAPTFTPMINRRPPSEQGIRAVSGPKRHNAILEKGREYQQKKYE